MSEQTTNYPVNIEQLSGQHGGSREFGPLLLTYNLDLTQENITVTAKFAGVTIGTRFLELMDPLPVEISGAVGTGKTQIILNSDPTNKTLNYNVDIEVLGSKVCGGKGILLNW
ncbi:hypothetical protein DS884_11605 [Tenacibaculum sp. E3R01]|uniref:hypothetical protein n=1 Tax=unclassified Tenacibaculum TaxID=2635139 RepID=UPI00089869BD|nr:MULTISPECIES: hypothetical protein [unclassified Tenacibaculum]RBW57220.1 hypothetical protein DS884_11605 [Tenacibaculum sp. E3R01]SEE26353.1 hypothetical protein SAMN04487765_1940 [Tenacibaculum sp. MAR_2010_89]